MDTSGMLTSGQIAARFREREFQAHEAVAAALGERDVYPTEAVESILRPLGCRLRGYRHQDDTWVLELAEDAFAVEIEAERYGCNAPLGAGPALAVTPMPAHLDAQ